MFDEQRIKTFRSSEHENRIILVLIDQLLKNNIIVSSKYSTCSPSFLIGKKNRNKRLVVDSTAVNKVSYVDHFPLPSAEKIINKLQSKKIFTKLDLSNGYFYVKSGPKTIDYTSFVVPQGQYTFFRLDAGPACF